MKREFVKTVPYNQVKFKWISDHYDIHLKGSCMLNGKLHEFENDYPKEGEEMRVRIYRLNFITRLKWYWNNGNLRNLQAIIGHIMVENQIKVFNIEAQNGYI